MLTKLQIFFNRYLSEKSQEETPLEHRLQLASAALMVEMIHVDEVVSDHEELQLRQLIEQRFQLSGTETEDLVQLASDEKHKNICLEGWLIYCMFHIRILFVRNTRY
jgi:uncharacterized tellurite resistance protein B-like protein